MQISIKECLDKITICVDAMKKSEIRNGYLTLNDFTWHEQMIQGQLGYIKKHCEIQERERAWDFKKVQRTFKLGDKIEVNDVCVCFIKAYESYFTAANEQGDVIKTSYSSTLRIKYWGGDEIYPSVNVSH